MSKGNNHLKIKDMTLEELKNGMREYFKKYKNLMTSEERKEFQSAILEVSITKALSGEPSKDMKNFSKDEVIEIGNKLAQQGLVVRYEPRSHSHNTRTLFPQTSAQYDWLKRTAGTTDNVIILTPAENVVAIFPELVGHVTSTKSGNNCRIDITL